MPRVPDESALGRTGSKGVALEYVFVPPGYEDAELNFCVVDPLAKADLVQKLLFHHRAASRQIPADYILICREVPNLSWFAAP